MAIGTTLLNATRVAEIGGVFAPWTNPEDGAVYDGFSATCFIASAGRSGSLEYTFDPDALPPFGTGRGELLSITVGHNEVYADGTSGIDTYFSWPTTYEELPVRSMPSYGGPDYVEYAKMSFMNTMSRAERVAAYDSVQGGMTLIVYFGNSDPSAQSVIVNDLFIIFEYKPYPDRNRRRSLAARRMNR